MFTWLYDSVFPALGQFFSILVNIGDSPTAYFGLLLMGDSLPYTIPNLFTGNLFDFTLPSYEALLMGLLDGTQIGTFIAEGLVSILSVVGTFIYNVCWSPFTHMPMFIGLPLGGIIFVLITIAIRLFVLLCGFAYKKA